jgi:uncharacterized OB-fold protein
MENSSKCPVCGKVYYRKMKFCAECGTNLQELKAVSVSLNPAAPTVSEKVSLKNQVFNIGRKAQKEITGVASGITEKAKDVTGRASDSIVQEKVSESIGNLVNMMINVSKDVVKKVPVDKVNALHLRADVNFVAFSVGITIDLDEIKKSQRITEKRKNIDDLP